MNKSLNNDTAHKRLPLSILLLVAMGVVFGDIGTSPLYAIKECFHGEYGIPITPENILGILSLIFWTLTIIVSIKYLTFILRADNKGEGGVLALTALIKGMTGSPTVRTRLLIGTGIFAACLLYGDGMITPAISVMSAIEGLRVITPDFQYVVPLTLLILTALFLLQHRGTARIGMLFGPIIVIWFVTLAVLGIRQIILNPDILAALSPTYAISFLLNSGLHGFTVLGAVFLSVTGAEALYADLGHFGARPVRIAWFYFVFPALILNYFGQGALLLQSPEESYHPFYALVPSWAMIPMVILATSATIIASQAIITGVFSISRQAIQMGYLPRLKVIHTSARHFGQIYVPQINWFMMIATLSLVIGFQTSSKLAAAYGVAVSLTMLISTMLFYVVARKNWNWNKYAASVPVALFLLLDFGFFSANIIKILHGAWFPLVLGAITMTIMITWKRGREILGRQLRALAVPFAFLKNKILSEKTPRVKGYAVFMTGQSQSVPIALTHNLEHNKIVHSNVLLLNFSFLEVPRVPNKDKLKIEDLGLGFHQVTAFYGFMESPSVPNVLALAAGQGLYVPIEQTSFFLGREKLIISTDRHMSRWRAHIFIFLSKNAYDASSFFDIPGERVVEVGIRLGI